MFSVVDSSISVHSKASGNFQLLTDSEGGDKTIGRVTVLIIGRLLVSRMHGMSMYLGYGKRSVLIHRSELPTGQNGSKSCLTVIFRL